jgi:glutathione S-transferase
MMRYAFKINDTHYVRVVERIEALLAELDADLADGRASLLGGETTNYTDIAFAAFTGLWLMVPGYGGGKADMVRLERERAPQSLRDDVERWRAAYPRAVTFVERLYETRNKVD